MNTDISINKNKAQLFELLKPAQNSANIELFFKTSKSQEKFTNELLVRGIKPVGTPSEELLESIKKIQHDVGELLENEDRSISEWHKKQDFELAKIFHKYLKLPRYLVNDFDFWRWMNLYHFMPLTHWRWINDSKVANGMIKPATSAFARSLGKKNRRIDCLRYWYLGVRLFDSQKGYQYLDRLSKACQSKEAPFQDYINNIIDTDLLSVNDAVSKYLGRIMLTEERVFGTKDLIASFKRFNSFKNRVMINVTEQTLRDEICILRKK